MKRCPECRRDYYDETLLYCLEDGVALVQGSVTSSNEPQTAVFSGADSPPRRQVLTTDQTVIHPGGIEAEPQPESFESQSERAGFSAHRAAKPLMAVALAAVVLTGGFCGYRYFSSANSKQIESIAVMPFANESGDADVEYLSDGMTETLIGSLSKIANLSVKARSAVYSYKGKDLSAKQIGDELGVQAVLLGRLVQRGGNIKLNLELVNAKTLDVIWSEQYDRKQADLVSLQSEIAQDVSSKLRWKLTGEDRQVLEKKYTNDPEAYRLYLQARFYLNKRVGKEYQKAEGFLRQAIARDPNFALGYVGLAEFIDDDDRPKAKEYILRALAIDNELSQAHAAYGYQLALDRDWAAAEREFTRAVELDPQNVRAHQWNGARLMFIGRHQECLAAYDRAMELEPTFADVRVNRGTCLAAAGRLDEGIAEVKKAIELDPSYPWSHSALSFLYRMKGDHAASVEARSRSAELVDRPDLAKRLRDTFRERGWKAYLQELFDQTAEMFPNLVRRASILCELGKTDEALIALERSAANGEWWLFRVKVDPQFDVLRDDPRFQAIVKQFEPPR
jgi:serine/threonine-protein kinase